MKKVLVFAAFAFVLASCNSVEKFKPAVDEVSAQWETTTGEVTAFAQSVADLQGAWGSEVAAMTVAPEAMAKWDDAAKAKYAEIQTAAAGNTAQLGEIATNVDGFIKDWTAKSAELQTLKDGMAAGKVEGDVAAQVESLKAAATAASAKLAEWNTSLATVKAAAGSSKEQFAAFMTTMGGAPATSGTK